MRLCGVLIILYYWLSGCKPQTTSSTSMQLILNDMRNAFKPMLNDSQLFKRIIPQMYATTLEHLAGNITFTFKMPKKDSAQGYEMLQMQRSDFAEPIFPNISSHRQASSSELNVKTADVVDKENWSSLGLDGWSGALMGPLQQLEQKHKDDYALTTTAKPYPLEDRHVYFTQGNFNGHVQDLKLLQSISLNERLQTSADENFLNVENVYLARVNDPFGYSVQWERKNSTTSSYDGGDVREERAKRDIVKLYSMIKCSTGCEPLIYKGYGCYCGFGGRGVATDGIDRCCKQHDKCYEYSNCISYLEYFVPYVWKCYRGKPLCAIDHGQWGGPDSCAARLCQCDLRLSRCLRKFLCPQQRAVCQSSRVRRLQNLIYFD